MSDAQPAARATKEYVAEFLDGPFAGRVEHRVLIDGKHEHEISEMASVDGSERLYWYLAEDSREIQGIPHVHYRWDARDSDLVQRDDTDIDSLRF